jgi:hypothetical protein
MLTQNCECIKVTYTLEGEEPVTVEVEKAEDGNYYFDGYEIEKDGEEWLVNLSCEKEVVVGVSSYLGVESTGIAVKVDEYNGESVYLAITQNNIGDFPNIGVVFFDGTKWIQRSVNGNIDVAESTDFITWTSLLEGYEIISTTVTTQSIECISVNYGETTVELLKVGIFEGQNAYIKGFNPITNYFDYAIGFNYNNILYEDKWVLVVSGVFSGVTVTDIGSTYILPKSPFINPPISENWMFTDGEDLGSVTTTPCDCGELQATLSEDTLCPFGVYTIEDDSIFEAFEVNPCTIPNPYVESINCYKLAVWSKQCEYSKCVLEYVNNLIFGIDVCKLEESLKEQRRVLEILNCYDPRDILGNTTNYNTITYTKIKQLLNHL